MQTSDIAFFLVPRFSMIALYSALEPLRVVNRYRPDRFTWKLLSADGGPVVASNGIEVAVTGTYDDFGRPDMVVVCASHDYDHHLGGPIVRQLRRVARSGVLMAGLDTGSFFLAEAGILDGFQATCHWETLPAFREMYPRVDGSRCPLYDRQGAVHLIRRHGGAGYDDELDRGPGGRGNVAAGGRHPGALAA